MKRSGILLPVFSLPGKYGIGSFGEEAYRFVDFLADTGQDYWQILPLNPTAYGDSPYQSPSAFAGNPYFVDLDILCGDGLLTAEECAREYARGGIDYGRLYRTRFALLRRAYARFAGRVPDSFYAFEAKNRGWLMPYCLFMSRKAENGGRAWTEWERKAYSEEGYRPLNFHAFVQFTFFTQWRALKEYANAHGVKIVGDMPIYVAPDSADVWSLPQNFLLTEDLKPVCVAGVPPDAFSKTGQLWGNPLYDWRRMQKDGFSWWLERFRHCFGLYDTVRIDHFRGFAAYYGVPYGESTAENGAWSPAPGEELFAAVNAAFPDAEIVAEDLGFLDERSRALLDKTGYPGIKVAQFGFDEPESEYLPARYPENCAAYTGTHDNTTAKAWAKRLPRDRKKYFRKMTGKGAFETAAHALVRSVLESDAALAVVPMQDYLETGEESRINTPATLGWNWAWRLPERYARFAKRIAAFRAARE